MYLTQRGQLILVVVYSVRAQVLAVTQKQTSVDVSTAISLQYDLSMTRRFISRLVI